jgi:Tfp pilus assembly protein FimT
MKNKNNPTLGFSLLELMIILAISALLLQLALPNYQAHLARAQALVVETERMEAEIRQSPQEYLAIPSARQR